MLHRRISNRYSLESEIGRGGMGVVYCAMDTQLDRLVAVKVLPAEFSHDTQFLERFRREVLNSAKLSHPNIVQVHDVGEDDGTNYFVMQLVEGSDLRGEIQKRGRFSVEETAEILSQIAGALDYAHEQGVVHRDIKPDNILIDKQGVARVVDFGIAKTVEGTRLTGGMIGTPEYMSPEQARGEALDGRSDQYSLAIVAYEMLTGTTPFRSDTTQPWALVNMHATVPPPDPRQFADDLPEHVVNALLQALQKMAGYRFSTCKQFVEALKGKIKATQPETRAATLPTNQTIFGKPKIHERTSVLLPVLLVIVAIAMMSGGWMVWQGTKTTTTTETHEVVKPQDHPVQPQGQDKMNGPKPQETDRSPQPPAQPAPNAAANTELPPLIEEWRQAWQSHDMSRFMSMYSAVVRVDGKTQSRDKYEAYHRGENESQPTMEVMVSNIEVVRSGQNRAVTLFNQHFKGYGKDPTYNWESWGKTRLEWVCRSGEWKITSEDFERERGGRW